MLVTLNNTVSTSNIQFQISILLNPMSFLDFTYCESMADLGLKDRGCQPIIFYFIILIYYFAKFHRKLHENEKKLEQEGTAPHFQTRQWELLKLNRQH